MKSKLFLVVLAVLGTTLGYFITDLLIINITILQFIGIEIVITVFHELYNLAKSDILKKS
jgi:hypothetical protein